MAPSAFAISSAAFAQDQLYTNGGLNYSLRGFGAVGNNQQNSGAAQTNGEELPVMPLIEAAHSEQILTPQAVKGLIPGNY